MNEPADRSSRDRPIGVNRRVIMDAIGVAIAELVPASSRGVYPDGRAFTAARDVLRDSR